MIKVPIIKLLIVSCDLISFFEKFSISNSQFKEKLIPFCAILKLLLGFIVTMTCFIVFFLILAKVSKKKTEVYIQLLTDQT